MPRRPRSLTDHDQANWAAYALLVRPLPGRIMPPAPATPPAAATPVRHAQPAPPAVRRPAHITTIEAGIQPPGLDTASWSRFQQGKMAPARTLDLHGKTAQAAFHALERFLHAARADQLRCVEIITGRGKGETGGVIRRELPMWLNLPSIRPMILAAAHPGGLPFRAANDGATRVLLRRTR